MKQIFIIVLLGVLHMGLIAGEPRIKSQTISTDSSEKAISSAAQQGVQSAKKDIKAGSPVILYFGKPWSQGKPLIDEKTGLTIEVVAGCTVSSCFVAEVKAYNTTIRTWHADKQKAEQDGADQPATAPESKPEGKENPKPESKVRPQ